jgi:hypothetical protein
VNGLLRWTVHVPGLDDVTVYADCAGCAFDEAADLLTLHDIPAGVTARNELGQEFACSSATS